MAQLNIPPKNKSKTIMIYKNFIGVNARSNCNKNNSFYESSENIAIKKADEAKKFFYFFHSGSSQRFDAKQ